MEDARQQPVPGMIYVGKNIVQWVLKLHGRGHNYETVNHIYTA